MKYKMKKDFDKNKGKERPNSLGQKNLEKTF